MMRKMTKLNWDLLVFVVSAICLTNVSALYGEDILKGLPSKEQKLNHQVAILAKRNYSDIAYLVGSGGIITHNLILTTAHIFIFYNGTLRNLTFFIVVGETNLNHKPKIQILIDKIYFPRDVNLLNKDISVAMLATSIVSDNNEFFRVILVPFAGEKYFGQRGIVSGYGFTSVTLNFSSNGNPYRYSGYAENKLKYANVEVISELNCSSQYSFYNPETQICARVVKVNAGVASGICEKDIGGPLVIGEKIVGLASMNQANCDDTVLSCIYTNVPYFSIFIDNIVDENIPEGTLIYANRQHVPSSAACAWPSICSWKIAKKLLIIEHETE